MLNTGLFRSTDGGKTSELFCRRRMAIITASGSIPRIRIA